MANKQWLHTDFQMQGRLVGAPTPTTVCTPVDAQHR